MIEHFFKELSTRTDRVFDKSELLGMCFTALVFATGLALIFALGVVLTLLANLTNGLALLLIPAFTVYVLVRLWNLGGPDDQQ